jgi:catechol 2,3-dioxygenase-like lactoylglutathione lyase family enzyme
MLLQGFNHVAVLTNDTERLHAFYRDVFDAKTHDVEHNEQMRLTFIEIGPQAMLNVFQFAGNTEADRQVPMFGRGRLDHYGLEAQSQEAFDEIRNRLIAKGATDGFVTDFGPELSLFFRDPDGLEGEVLFAHKPGSTDINPPGTKAEGYDVVGTPEG